MPVKAPIGPRLRRAVSRGVLDDERIAECLEKGTVGAERPVAEQAGLFHETLDEAALGLRQFFGLDDYRASLCCVTKAMAMFELDAHAQRSRSSDLVEPLDPRPLSRRPRRLRETRAQARANHFPGQARTRYLAACMLREGDERGAARRMLTLAVRAVPLLVGEST